MNPQQRLTTPFGFHSTASEVIQGVDLTGKRAIVTGATSGIGVETARALAGAGADVTLAVRNVEAGHRVAEEITAKTGNPRVAAAPLQLADQASVASFTDAWHGPLHILVNNAGIMALPELQRSPEGWELQFATNYLGHFNLALGLHKALAAAGGARLVSLSSIGHLFSPVVFDDINFERRPYEEWAAYGQAKTANSLLAIEAATRWADDGITANAVMPGGIRTGLQRHQEGNMTPEIEAAFDAFAWKTVEQGAATSVLAAASPLLAGVTGRYFENCNEAEVHTHLDPTATTGVLPYALDAGDATRLWDVATKMLHG
ncbi:SDR family NAD(P)-dependent oxidoreductase [Streptomyces sp. NBC_00038]|uniref:SDR family NAD(P)-dependent oxidoreductase n=1 Tax=Streptomyces sp. NBC_00038 TaxID=2903615 RepID=UPI00224DEA95|nr:SDR family NAD(P)-dependent oxidoreductase [Streptomyces sp. NBC_00038]MCX5554624.1 SDR family NAD(P)-dependent oxidoreductase [Streptomyces sp. NBC_00038]